VEEEGKGEWRDGRRMEKRIPSPRMRPRRYWRKEGFA
jgi:hypothetical protein